jgi:hypothetical protein
MEEQQQPNNNPEKKESEEGSQVIEGETLSQAAWKAYKAEFASSFVPTFNFAMVAIAVLAVGVWQPYTLFLTIPFLLIPFYFALQISISDARQGHPYSNKNFLHFFAMYFKLPYLGVYRVVVSALFSFLWGVLISSLVAIVYYLIGTSVSAPFADAMNDFYNAIQNGNATAVTDLLNGNSYFETYFIVVSVSEYGIWFLSLLQYLGVWSLNPYTRAIMKRSMPSPRMANSLFIGSLKSIRGRFAADYFKGTWLGLVLSVVGFALGSGLGYLWKHDPLVLVACGVAVSVLFLFFYLPYFLIVVELLADHYDEDFAKYSVTFAENALKQLEETKRLSEEEAKEIQKMIDDAKNGNPPPPDDDDDDDYQ